MPHDLSHSPTQAERLLGRALALHAERRAAEALPLFEAALACGLDLERGAGERWHCAMLAGRFEDAWKESDRVLARRRRDGERCADRPLHLRWVWDGTSPAGRDVLLRCYHGLGDSIQFLRYAPLLRRTARSVTVEAPAALLPLLRSLEGVDRLLPLEDGPRPAGGAVAIESTELPHAFRTTLGTIPAEIPYLRADPGRAEARRRAMDRDMLNVGLVWASGLWRPERNIPLALLAGLGRVPGVALHCLQRGPCREEMRTGGPAFCNPEEESADIAETAALIAALDLVISTDTMVAHLAGALGRPVWTLLHFDADWRWLATGDRSPWYPTMRLFRQPRPGDWDAVAALLTAALAAHAAGRIPAPVRRR